MNSTTKPVFNFKLPSKFQELIDEAPNVTVAKNVNDLVNLSVGGEDGMSHEVFYDLPGGERKKEAIVHRVKNGIAANYVEPYMRRRDPKCMVIADEFPTDKSKFEDRFDYDFEELRDDTFEWMKTQDLAMFIFNAGKIGMGYKAIAVIPANAGFFGLGLALLQGILNPMNSVKILNRVPLSTPLRHSGIHISTGSRW